MSNSKTIRLRAETLERLSKHTIGFENPDLVVNRVLDKCESLSEQLRQTIENSISKIKELEAKLKEKELTEEP